jgi:hypothetical protein
MTPENPAAPSLTVGDVRWLHAQTVLVVCRACPHQQVANVDALPDSVPLSLISSRFTCPCCGQQGALVFPNWDTEPGAAGVQ